jgi:hypothetical protein
MLTWLLKIRSWGTTMVICSASIILVSNGCKSIHQEDHDCENRKRKLGEAQAVVGLASFKLGIDHSA